LLLDLNQDAMVCKSELLQRQSQRVNTLIVVAVLAAFLVGLFASTSLTHRALRPVSVLSQAVAAGGQVDMAARAVVEGRSGCSAGGGGAGSAPGGGGGPGLGLPQPPSPSLLAAKGDLEQRGSSRH
jgi:hypothetical protein